MSTNKLKTDFQCNRKLLHVYFFTITQGRIQADAIDANESVRKKMPMRSSVRFLPQIIKNSTFCENTRPIMHKFQQSYFFLEMTTTHILNLHLKDLFSKKTCSRTNTLSFPPLIYTAMFQNLIFNKFYLRFCICFRECMY